MTNLMDKIQKATSINELRDLISSSNCKGFCGITMCNMWLASREEINNLPKKNPEGILCPFLGSKGECTEYEKRPLICRIQYSDWNRCKWGCKPNVRLTKNEADAILQKSYEIGSGMDSLWIRLERCPICNEYVPSMAIIHPECAVLVRDKTKQEFIQKYGNLNDE